MKNVIPALIITTKNKRDKYHLNVVRHRREITKISDTAACNTRTLVAHFNCL